MENGYDFLIYAIIKQAITDYKQALRRGDNGKVISLERWFKSDWGELLSGYNGAYIVERVKKEVETEKRKNGRC